MTTLRDYLDALPEERQEKIEELKRGLIAEYMTMTEEEKERFLRGYFHSEEENA